VIAVSAFVVQRELRTVWAAAIVGVAAATALFAQPLMDALRRLPENATSTGAAEGSSPAASLRVNSPHETAAHSPAQLPAVIADFVGRQRDLVRLRTQLSRTDDETVRVIAIVGKPGIGKTTLVVKVAQQLRSVFPDAQLQLNLRGTQALPLQPLEALIALLAAMDVPEKDVRRDLEDAAATYRSVLAGKRALIVLDDARDERQVRPLLPGSPNCAVLITSRSPLEGLAEAVVHTLGLLTEGEALDLLAGLAGPDRVAADPTSAAEIVKYCGFLPLAVRIAGARLRKRSTWTVTTLAERLSDERRRLEELQAGDLAIRASFALSYRGLIPEDRRTFRRLGLLNVPTVTTDLAGAVVGRSQQRAAAALERLTDAQLLEPDQAGRYRFHDLLRLFALERAEAEEHPWARRWSRRRAYRWYLVAARQAERRMHSSQPGTGHLGRRDALLASRAHAQTWMAIERSNLVAVAAQAAADPLTRRLSRRLATVLDRTSWLSTIQSLALTQGDDLPRVRDITDPISLGVHPAVPVDQPGFRELGQASAVPTYVPRDVDDTLDAALGRATTGRAFVLVVGDSAAGKTRVAYEAMRRTVPDWRLIVPGSRESLAALLNVDMPLHDTVVWLDDLERFLGPDGLTIKLLDRLAGDRSARVAVLATMRAAEWRAIADGGMSGLRVDLASIERYFHVVRLSRHFTPAELARANDRAWDPRIATALAATRSSHEIPELLVASLRLLERWRHADALDNPSAIVGGAIVTAAIDCRRAGFLRPIPEALLYDLYSVYLPSRFAHPVDRHVFQQGLAWATTPVAGIRALLMPAADRFAVADYLVATREADVAAPPVPQLVWERILAHLHEDDALTVAGAAEQAGQMLVAERAYRKAADGGHASAMRALGRLVERRGNPGEAITYYRKAVAAGDSNAAADLARLTQRPRDSGVRKVACRVMRRLLDLAQQQGDQPDQGRDVNLWVKQDELAGWIGASRSATARVLKGLRQEGIITTRPAHIVIHDLEALRRREAQRCHSA